MNLNQNNDKNSLWIWSFKSIHPAMSIEIDGKNEVIFEKCTELETEIQYIWNSMEMEKKGKIKHLIMNEWNAKVLRYNIEKKSLKRKWKQEHLLEWLESLKASVIQSKKWIEAINNAVDTLNWEDYEKRFDAYYRKQKRTFKIVLGPTNSGKTYQALEALKNLKEGQKGVYLGPLRLLALEVFEKLNDHHNESCSLMTGDDQRVYPNAWLKAQTIEMLNPKERFDIAIIDEIQMMQDPARGSAWTAALCGLNADVIYVLGSMEALESLKSVERELGWNFDWTFTKRETPLKIESFSGEFKNKDAWVCFSRKSVLEKAQELSRKGISTSVLYGALSPENRQKQAKRFESGETQVLVCTDVIGMGLNLPIERVILSTTEKFNGKEVEALTQEEIRQICGRSGRRGCSSGVGVVTAENAEDVKIIRAALQSKPEEKGSEKWLIKPSLEDLIEMDRLNFDDSRVLNDDQKWTIRLKRFEKHMTFNHPLWKSASLEDWKEKAFFFKKQSAMLSDEVFFNYLNAPFDPEYAWAEEVRQWAQLQGMGKTIPLNHSWIFKGHEVEVNSFKLMQAEQDQKRALLYRWLGYRYPESFINQSECDRLIEGLSLGIDRALKRHTEMKEEKKWKGQSKSSRRR